MGADHRQPSITATGAFRGPYLIAHGVPPTYIWNFSGDDGRKPLALVIVKEISKITEYNSEFARILMSLSNHNELRRINGFAVSVPVKTYFFKNQLFWWASRLYGRTPGVPTQSNNLFGYGSPSVNNDLTAVVEVNLPWGKLGVLKVLLSRTIRPNR
jgi:hypothetical protein